ncbi:MAG: mRNA interferase MazF [Thermodesulfobacteriota bacterium]|nr:mRNA interferase MazF [Thermodesulfobacteriota bacterium]
MKTGEIYWVNLDPTIGDEIKKRRPVVVLNGGHQKHLKLAISAPITAWKACWEENPFFVSLDPDPNNGLQKKSIIDCFQIRAISHKRFGQKIGRISNDQIDRLKEAIALILDIDPHHCD